MAAFWPTSANSHNPSRLLNMNIFAYIISLGASVMMPIIFTLLGILLKIKPGKALLDTTVSGVAFDMLKTVDMISDKIEWVSSGFCGKKQPMAVSMGGPMLRCKIMIGGR